MEPASACQPLSQQRQEIRLLRISPSSETQSPIYCSIFIVSLKDDPPPSYQALSYVCGDPELTAEINIEGTDSPTTIGFNLALALQCMRHASYEVILWVDALCINQNDNHERGRQVRMMCLIYSKAEEVIAWLGEEEDDDQIALDLVESWATFWATPNRFKESGKQPFGVTTLDAILDIVPMALDSRANMALQLVAKRPYWTRAWIYQELALAKQARTQCGRTSEPLDYFLRTYEGLVFLMLPYSTGDVPTGDVAVKVLAHPMVHMLSMIKKSDGVKPFCFGRLPPNMLSEFKALKATDPRDKVFALLGLVALESPYSNLLHVDYEKKVERVYTDVTKYLILTEQTLHVLNLAQTNPSAGCKWSLPTWVPNWQSDGRWLSDTLSTTWQTYIESVGEEARVLSNLISQLVNFSTDSQLLLAKGFELDVISELYDNGLFPFWLDAELSGTRSMAIENFMKHIMGGPLVNGETTLSAYFRLMIYNSPREHDEPDPERRRFLRSAAEFLRYLFTQVRNCLTFPAGSFLANNIEILPFTLTIAFLGIEAPQVEREKLVDLVLDEDLDVGFYNAKVRYTVADRLLFRTKGRWLGLGPQNMAKGDILCQLAAHPDPFLLRPIRVRYTSVGVCKVLDLDLPSVVEEMIPHMRVVEIQ